MRTTATRSRLQTRSWLSVVRAYQTCERQYARLLDHYGLTIAQFDVLSAIDELGDDATPARIASRLLVTKGNITGLLDRLASQGLIETAPNPDDGRSRRCRLADDAVPLLAETRRAAAAFITRQLEPFSDAELEATERQMHRMREQLERLDVPALHATFNRTRGRRHG